MKNKTTIFQFISVSVVALCLFWIPSLHANSGPLVTLKNNVTQVLKVLQNPENEISNKDQRESDILKEISFMFDFTSFSRGALGANWRRFSAEQKIEFTHLFTRLVARAYLAKLDNQNIEDFTISYLQAHDLKPTKSGIQRSDVFTKVLFNGKQTPVDYRMFYKNKAWKIYDVKIEGVSMVANYRKQYQQRFMDSPEKMIKQLQDKLQKNIN